MVTVALRAAPIKQHHAQGWPRLLQQRILLFAAIIVSCVTTALAVRFTSLVSAVSPARRSGMSIQAPRWVHHLHDSHVLFGHLPVNRSLLVPVDLLPIDVAGMREVCAVVQCRRESNCTLQDTSCCMFYNARLLDFVTRFLSSHGMQREWFAIFGTVVGALRHPGGLLPWTNDLDIAMTPRLQRFLESAVVRDLMWQHGYYFFKQDMWRICPHPLHPDPVWQAAFSEPRLSSPIVTASGGRPRTLIKPRAESISHVYMDLWPSERLDHTVNGAYFSCDPCPDPALEVSRDLYFVWVNAGWIKVTFRRKASIGGIKVTIPDNAEEHVAAVYGEDWRTPQTWNSGKWGRSPQGTHNIPRAGIFAGAPDAWTRSQWQAGTNKA